jgi:hypothetical protein
MDAQKRLLQLIENNNTPGVIAFWERLSDEAKTQALHFLNGDLSYTNLGNFKIIAAEILYKILSEAGKLEAAAALWQSLGHYTKLKLLIEEGEEVQANELWGGLDVDARRAIFFSRSGSIRCIAEADASKPLGLWLVKRINADGEDPRNYFFRGEGVCTESLKISHAAFLIKYLFREFADANDAAKTEQLYNALFEADKAMVVRSYLNSIGALDKPAMDPRILKILVAHFSADRLFLYVCNSLNVSIDEGGKIYDGAHRAFYASFLTMLNSEQIDRLVSYGNYPGDRTLQLLCRIAIRISAYSEDRFAESSQADKVLAIIGQLLTSKLSPSGFNFLGECLTHAASFRPLFVTARAEAGDNAVANTEIDKDAVTRILYSWRRADEMFIAA